MGAYIDILNGITNTCLHDYMFALVPIINKQNPKRIGCNNEELYVLSLYFLLLL